MTKYIYDGPVKSFDRIVATSWHGETIANSEAKARSNLIYRYKKEKGLSATTKITLPGPLMFSGFHS